MKKIINKLQFILMFSVLATACTSDKKEEKNTKTNAEILQEVTEVKAIGKVVSADDYSVIASATAGQISNILVQVGDSVQKGQLILKLGAGNSSLDIEEAKA